MDRNTMNRSGHKLMIEMITGDADADAVYRSGYKLKTGDETFDMG